MHIIYMHIIYMHIIYMHIIYMHIYAYIVGDSGTPNEDLSNWYIYGTIMQNVYFNETD